VSTIASITSVPAGTWRLDPVHSSVGFEIVYLAGTFKGQFRDVEATLAVDGERATLEGAAKVASVDVKDENFAAHLQSPDFFDAERHPELRFESTEIRREGGDFVVSGELTLKGQTRPVELRGSVTEPVDDPYGRRRLGIELETTIDRTDFGIDWNAELPSGGQVLANDVQLTARLELVQDA